MNLTHSVFIKLLLLLSLVLPLTHAAETDGRRIVSVDSNATEILTSLGFADAIVAADVTSQNILSNNVPNLGYHRLLNTEGVLATRPDLIVGSNHMGPPATVSTIKKANIELVQLYSPTSVNELKQNIEQVGVLLKVENRANALIDELELQASRIKDKSNHDESTMIFLIVAGKGLSQAGAGTTADALIQLLGGQNVSQFSNYKPTSMESLLAIQPDVILIGQRTDKPVGLASLLKQQPLLAKTKAARNHKIISVDASRLIAGLSLGAIDEAENIANQLAELDKR